MTRKNRIPYRDLRAAGRDWARDFGQHMHNPENEGQSAAFEIAAAYVPGHMVSAAAEEVYEGMLKVLAQAGRLRNAGKGKASVRAGRAQALPNIQTEM
jgi:hypothetical protein